MSDPLTWFEEVVRGAFRLNEAVPATVSQHPFDTWNIHSALPKKVRSLFDDAHYAEATFAACKYVEQEVRRLAAASQIGESLMMAVFNEASPRLKVNALPGTSGTDEQRGYKFLFAGLIAAIRNPRGHEYSVADNIDTCLEHLSFISHLLRRLEKGGCVLRAA